MMMILLKLIDRSNAIPIKISVTVLSEIDKQLLEFIWKINGHRIVETILEKENKVEGLIFLFQNLLHSYSNQDL